MAHLRPRNDVVRVDSLVLNVRLADGVRWPSSSPPVQPVALTAEIVHDCEPAAQNDDLSASINYGVLSKTISQLCDKRTASEDSFSSLEELASEVAKICFASFPIQELRLLFRKPKALLHAAAVLFEATFIFGDLLYPVYYAIEGLIFHTIIGVNEAERVHEQIVRTEVNVERHAEGKSALNFSQLAGAIGNAIKGSSFLTLEAFASTVARTTLESLENETDVVTARLSKPSAILFAEAAQVEVTRRLSDYTAIKQPSAARTNLPSLRSLLQAIDTQPQASSTVTATIALGSNIGDRFANIELALRLLEDSEFFADSANRKAIVVDTSFLYETAPMYVLDQPEFINAVCVIETDLEPLALLSRLKAIENAVGRVPSIRNGPRAVDLDILTYGSQRIDTRSEDARAGLDNLQGELVIPHPRITEREFVLRPFCDVLPDFRHPVTQWTMSSHLDGLMRAHRSVSSSMYRVVPFPRYPFVRENRLAVPPTHSYWRYPLEDQVLPPEGFKTRLMATLNATPDSFSDGAVHNKIPEALTYARTSIAAGADIIDVGGYSTRPGAGYVTPEEEIRRVVPVIEALRTQHVALEKAPNAASQSSLDNTLISVDTFRADVARAAIAAGANCINDVYAFTGPSYPLTEESAAHFLEFRKVARELATPVVLMHSRGEASSNKDYSSYSSAGQDRDVVEGVRAELGERVDEAVQGRGGLRRWQVIVDPGVGFSKTVDGNLQILRHVREITGRTHEARNPLLGFPQLIGASRKSFLGSILAKEDGSYAGRQTEPHERVSATAAAIACAVQQRALVVRVHDVLEMGDVLRVSNALWGGPSASLQS